MTRSYEPASTLGALSFSASSSGTSAISSSQSQPPSAARTGEVLPAAADRRRDRGHGVEGVGTGAHRLEAGLQPDPLLGGAGAGEVGVVLVLLDLLEERRGVVDRRALAQPVGPVDEERRLLGGGHLERVHVVRRDPRDVVVDRLRCDLDGTARHLGRDHRDRDRLLGDADRLLGREHDPRREAPGTAVDDPHREPEVLGVARALQRRRRARPRCW